MAKTRFHSLLEAKLREAVESRATSVVSGVCKDYAHYMHSVGFIEGLGAAAKYCDEVEQELE